MTRERMFELAAQDLQNTKRDTLYDAFLNDPNTFLVDVINAYKSSAYVEMLMWKCPSCGNEFGPDGVRYLTRSQDCECLAMPKHLREKR